MSTMNRVYVARKSCGCIVAAFPVSIDKAVKGELLKQLAKAGLDIEQSTDIDVRMDFHLVCDHNRPPLLQAIDEVTYRRAGSDYRPTENAAIGNDDGVDQADVDAAGTDLTPEAEEAEAAIEAEEALAEEKTIDHQAEADNLLSDFLKKKDGEEDAEDEDGE
jgi:hypothetical protein